MIQSKYPPGALVRLIKQSLEPGMLFSSQQTIDIPGFTSDAFDAWLLAQNRDFGCIQLFDNNAILPYSTLEIVLLKTGQSMPQPHPYTFPLGIPAGAPASVMTTIIADQIRQWINYWKPAYPAFQSMKVLPISEGGNYWTRILMPWGVLGQANPNSEMPVLLRTDVAIGQNAPMIPTIRGRNLGLLPVNPEPQGYYYGDNPYEYYAYDYLNPVT